MTHHQKENPGGGNHPGQGAKKSDDSLSYITTDRARQAALPLLDAGFSVIPAGPDKRPLLSWKEYQGRRMTIDEAHRYFSNGARLAVVAGMVSGNLECLDFDDPAAYEPFLELLEIKCKGLPAKLLKRRTPSGGYHLLYRASELVSGNLKLACDNSGAVRIETRGEGGYFLSAPSPGYEVISGSLEDCPTLSAPEVLAIHLTAQAFDQRPTKITPKTSTPKGNGESPGDQFNQAHTVAEILEPNGWTPDQPTTAGMGWTRPGKEGGVSGVLLENGNFYCWSSNATPLEPGQSYSPFALYTMFNHGGDYSAAARELARQGYGSTVAEVATVAVAKHKTEWPEPEPLTSSEQSAPYPVDALPGIIGAAVREVVDFVQCPVALGACSALAVVSTVAQGLVDVRRAGKLEGPTSVYLLGIADSGERKTTVDGFFSKPVAQWEAEQAEAAKPDLKRYEAEQSTWEAKKSGLLAAVKELSKKGKSTTELERKMMDLEAEKPYPPKVPRLLFGDSTPEALAHRLAHGWPVGGVLSSEAGMVFGGHAMGKDSAMRNMAMLNSLWGAEPLTIDRRSVPSFTVRGARLTMGLAVQSETVRAFLDSSQGLARGIGWLARFLIAWPESTQGNRPFKEPPETWPDLSKFHRRLGTMLDYPLPLDDQGELQPVMLELSPEAKQLWIAFHNDIEEELLPGRDMAEARDVASKAADNSARLAGLFHLFENGPTGTISPDLMRAAAALAGWHLYEARRFMGEIAQPVEKNNAAKLDTWILEHCRQNNVGEISTGHIQQRGPGCIRDKRTLDTALEELADAGRVRVVKDGRRKLVQINPALLRY